MGAPGERPRNPHPAGSGCCGACGDAAPASASPSPSITAADAARLNHLVRQPPAWLCPASGVRGDAAGRAGWLISRQQSFPPSQASLELSQAASSPASAEPTKPPVAVGLEMGRDRDRDRAVPPKAPTREETPQSPLPALALSLRPRGQRGPSEGSVLGRSGLRHGCHPRSGDSDGASEAGWHHCAPCKGPSHHVMGHCSQRKGDERKS